VAVYWFSDVVMAKIGFNILIRYSALLNHLLVEVLVSFIARAEIAPDMPYFGSPLA
jgi:hypothetical protein